MIVGYFKSCLVLLIVCCLQVDGKAFERKLSFVSSSLQKQPHLQKALFQTRGGADTTIPSSSSTTTTIGNILNDKSAKDTLSSCLLAAGLSGSSDIVAQLIAGKNKCSLRRLLTSATAGVVALGVPGPFFYTLMKKWFPASVASSVAATTSDSTTKSFLFKLLIGSVVYGSLIATIFMAAALMQSDDTEFSWEALSETAEEELPRFALVTVLFWGFLYPQKERIGIAGPMFVWMTFLSMTAYK